MSYGAKSTGVPFSSGIAVSRSPLDGRLDYDKNVVTVAISFISGCASAGNLCGDVALSRNTTFFVMRS